MTVTSKKLVALSHVSYVHVRYGSDMKILLLLGNNLYRILSIILHCIDEYVVLPSRGSSNIK